MVMGLLITIVMFAFGYEPEETRNERTTTHPQKASMVWACARVGFEGGIKKFAKDPDSVQVFDYYITYNSGSMYDATIDWGARNSFGGMVRHTSVITIDYKDIFTCPINFIEAGF